MDSDLQHQPIKRLRAFHVGMDTTEITGCLESLRAQFTRFRAVACHALLDDALLKRVQQLSDTGGWLSEQVELGHRQVESPQRASRLLNLALSRPAMLRRLEEIAGCGPLRAVEGLVTQALPRPEDRLDWHDDLLDPARRLAIVMQLGDLPYEGGAFELRYKKGPSLLTYQHAEPGSALIFQVAHDLEHRVLPVVAGGPRRVFAGWAMAGTSAR